MWQIVTQPSLVVTCFDSDTFEDINVSLGRASQTGLGKAIFI